MILDVGVYFLCLFRVFKRWILIILYIIGVNIFLLSISQTEIVILRIPSSSSASAVDFQKYLVTLDHVVMTVDAGIGDVPVLHFGLHFILNFFFV